MARLCGNGSRECSERAQSTYTTQPLSYFASGPGHVAVRSSWQRDAVWASFVSGKYINATGWLPQAGGDQGEQVVYDQWLAWHTPT